MANDKPSNYFLKEIINQNIFWYKEWQILGDKDFITICERVVLSHLSTITVSSDYGYVILVAVGSAFMLAWKAIKVGQARKKFGIEYPTMYSPTNDHFNCYQRAHQNTLENYPQFLTLLLLGGLEHPLISAAAGSVWILGRIAYARGYYTGDPKNRVQGGFSYFGLITLLGTTTKLALRLIGIV